MAGNNVKYLNELEEDNTKFKKMFTKVSLENHPVKMLFLKMGTTEK